MVVLERYLLVDGYNVINAWPELNKLKEENFEHARAKLIEILSNYSGFKGIKIIIVFDAHQVKGGIERRERHGKIEVIYTQEGIIADMVIEKLINFLPKSARVYVATSDKVEQDIIWGKGAYRISSRELLLEVQRVKKEARSYYKKNTANVYRLDDNLTDDIRDALEKLRRGQ